VILKRKPGIVAFNGNAYKTYAPAENGRPAMKNRTNSGLIQKPSEKELVCIIFFSQIIIVVAILGILFLEIETERLALLIFVLALSSLISAIKLLRNNSQNVILSEKK
jgi:hypothetical protein